MATEWACECKDCGKEFRYSANTYVKLADKGQSRPERCPDCRKYHGKETGTVGQPYCTIRPLVRGVDHTAIPAPLGRLANKKREHTAHTRTPRPLDPQKFGIKDDRLLAMFRMFEADPGLQVMVVVGPTGSGKSTILPYRLVEPPVVTLPDVTRDTVRDPKMFWRYGQIVVTQPRIQATRNIPRFIAEAMVGCSLGAGFDVGFRHSGSPASDWNTKLAFVTDGTLITWISSGQLDKVNTVMIDEAHERSLNIDIIIGLLTQLLPRYPRLRVIIASATISSEKFVNHFERYLPARFAGAGEEVTVRAVAGSGVVEVDHPAGVDGLAWAAKDEDGNPVTPETEPTAAAGPSGRPLVRLKFGKPGRFAVRAAAGGRAATLRAKRPNCELMEFAGKSFKVTPHFRPASEKPLGYSRVALGPDATGVDRFEGRYDAPQEVYKDVADKLVGLVKAMYQVDHDGYVPDPDLDLTELRRQNVPFDEQAIRRIDLTERKGDLLGFLHGEKPIKGCVDLIARRADQELRGVVKVEALPLYTTLPQHEQDKALLERPQTHDLVARRIRKTLGAIAAGDQPAGDVLAILNNAGQIHNLCDQLSKELASPTVREKKKNERGEEVEVEKPNPIHPLAGRVTFHPWFTPVTALQLFETMPERANLRLPPPDAAHARIRVVISTTRHRDKLTASEFRHTLEEDRDETRRVVISTNVAETSLTIHGILHVVDSGLINQNKWDGATQTSGVSPILQSRAGCKQRWGRAGRLQAGDAWPLYTKAQFGREQEEEAKGGPDPARCFEFYSLPEILRSPLEQVTLTAKAAGVDDLDPRSFPWIDPPDPAELTRSMDSLRRKGAVDDRGDLTAHGLEICRVTEEAKIANLLIAADRFAAAVEMATVIAVSRVGLMKLFRFDPGWDDATRREVQQRQDGLLAGCRDDLEAALKVVACWSDAQDAGRTFVRLADCLAEMGGFAVRVRKEAGRKHRAAADGFLDAVLAATTPEAAAELRAFRDRPGVRREWLRTAATLLQRGFDGRRRWADLAGRWRALVATWAWQEVLEERLLSKLRTAVVADRVFAVSTAEAPFDDRLAALAAYFTPGPGVPRALREFLRRFDAQSRAGEAARRAHCAGLVAKKLAGRAVLPEGDDTARQFVDRVRAMREPDHLVAICAEFPKPWADKLRAALPAAAAAAFARLYYLDERALAEKIEPDRHELLQPLAAHKKEDERRPLDFTHLDRVRLVCAAGLPDQCFRRAGDGWDPVIPPPETGKPAPAIRVDPRSVCASREPAAFACLERRAKPAEGKKEASLTAGFLVAVKPEWLPAVAAGSDDEARDPARVLFRLVRLLADTPPEPADVVRDRLFLDQAWPPGAVCPCVVVGPADGGGLAVEVGPPEDSLGPVAESFRKESREEQPEEPELAEEKPAGGDLGLDKKARQTKFAPDPEDDEADWTEVFGFRLSPEDVWDLAPSADGQPAPAVAADAAEPDDAPREIPLALHLPVAGTVRGVLSGRTDYAPGETVRAAVTGFNFRPDGPPVPRLQAPFGDEATRALFAHLPEGDPVGAPLELRVVGLTALALGRGTALVAQHPPSGCEFALGPADLTFSRSPLVPDLVFQAVGAGNPLKVRVLDADPMGRVRVSLLPEVESCWPAQPPAGGWKARVLEVGSFGVSVQLLPPNPVPPGVVFVARLPADQLPDVKPGAEVVLPHVARRTSASVQWPAGVDPPQGLYRAGNGRKVKARRPVGFDALKRWLGGVADPVARGALIDLYAQASQLDAADQQAVDRVDALIGIEVFARVEKLNEAGAELRLEVEGNPRGWMPNFEVGWRTGEQSAAAVLARALEQNEPLSVLVVDADPARGDITVSRRRTLPNPYETTPDGAVVTGRVVDRNDAGFLLDVDGLTGFLGFGQTAVAGQDPTRAFATGDEVRAAVVGRETARRPELKLSRVWLAVDRLRAEHPVGSVVEARFAGKAVKGGAVLVIAVQGEETPPLAVEAFLPAGEVSWEPADDPVARIPADRPFPVVVTGYAEPGSKNRPVSVSLRRATAPPAAAYAGREGVVLPVTVDRAEPGGLWVRLDGATGWVPRAELAWVREVADPTTDPAFAPGRSMKCAITEVNPDRNEIWLSRRALTRARVRLAGPGLGAFFGKKWANVNRVLEARRPVRIRVASAPDEGPSYRARLETVDKPAGVYELRADDEVTLEAVFHELTALAAEKGCTLTRVAPAVAPPAPVPRPPTVPVPAPPLVAETTPAPRIKVIRKPTPAAPSPATPAAAHPPRIKVVKKPTPAADGQRLVRILVTRRPATQPPPEVPAPPGAPLPQTPAAREVATGPRIRLVKTTAPGRPAASPPVPPTPAAAAPAARPAGAVRFTGGPLAGTTPPAPPASEERPAARPRKGVLGRVRRWLLGGPE